jgi:hypothetical protein
MWDMTSATTATLKQIAVLTSHPCDTLRGVIL